LTPPHWASSGNAQYCLIRRLERAERFRGLAECAAPVITHDASRDAEQPRLDRGAPFELGEPAMNDQEDLLHDVVDVQRCYAQPPCAAPHEIEVCLVYLGQSERVMAHGMGLATDVRPRRARAHVL
jgi:hypothetical protein